MIQRGLAIGTLFCRAHTPPLTLLKSLKSTQKADAIDLDVNLDHIVGPGERGGLVVNASDSRSRGRGFEPHSGQTVLCP